MSLFNWLGDVRAKVWKWRVKRRAAQFKKRGQRCLNPPYSDIDFAAFMQD